MQLQLPKIKIQSLDDQRTLLLKLAEMPGPPAGVLLVAESHAKNHIPEAYRVQLPRPLGTFYHSKYRGLSLAELHNISKQILVDIKITSAQSESISKATVDQSQSKFWFRFRSYRVTASKFYQVIRTRVNNPFTALINNICYPEAKTFSVKATR